MRQLAVLIALSLMLASTAVEAKTFYPMINKISPAAVQAGTSIDCEITAEHGWYAPTKVLITGEGVTGEVIPIETKPDGKPPAPGDAVIKVRFTATAEATPGIHDVRIMTARGPSTLGQLAVVRSPIVREEGVNNSTDKAQPVTLPAAVCGAIESNEDIDVYQIQIAEPKELLFHLTGQRFLQKLGPVAYHSDPLLTLRNAAGTILASNDNYFGSDPALSYRFQTPGDYFLEVRDVRYVGYRDWVYVLEMHDRPFVLQALTAGVRPGSPAAVRLVGFNLPAEASLTLDFPSDAVPGVHRINPGLLGGKSAEPMLPVFVASLAMTPEASSLNDTFETAQPIALPAGIAGIVSQPDDVDCYSFEAKKGDRLTFQVISRAVGSPLDSYLRVLDEKGAVLIENDDASDKTGNSDCRNEITSADSRIADWTVPADGKFTVEVRDTHLRGGDRFTYYLEVRPRRAGLHLEIDTDKTVLAPGVTAPAFIRAFREEGLTGPIKLSVDGLPPGVTAICGEVPADGQDACIFLTAADDAPLGVCANIRVIGEAIDPDDANRKLTATAVPFHELRRDGGARYMTPVEMHTVGVADVLDLKHIHVSETSLALKPGEKRAVQVTFERAPSFKEPVTLTGMHSQHVWVFGRCLPHGITVDEKESKLRVTGDEVQGTVVLAVAKDAKPSPPRLAPLMANVAINFSIRMMYCGEPVLVSIEAP